MDTSYDATILKEIETIKREAIEKTGFNDFGDMFFEEPLAAWVHDISTQNISDFGKNILRSAMYKDLCRQSACLHHRASRDSRGRNPAHYPHHGRPTHRYNPFAQPDGHSSA